MEKERQCDAWTHELQNAKAQLARCVEDQARQDKELIAPVRLCGLKSFALALAPCLVVCSASLKLPTCELSFSEIVELHMSQKNKTQPCSDGRCTCALCSSWSCSTARRRSCRGWQKSSRAPSLRQLKSKRRAPCKCMHSCMASSTHCLPHLHRMSCCVGPYASGLLGGKLRDNKLSMP